MEFPSPKLDKLYTWTDKVTHCHLFNSSLMNRKRLQSFKWQDQNLKCKCILSRKNITVTWTQHQFKTLSSMMLHTSLLKMHQSYRKIKGHRQKRIVRTCFTIITIEEIIVFKLQYLKRTHRLKMYHKMQSKLNQKQQSQLTIIKLTALIS